MRIQKVAKLVNNLHFHMGRHLSSAASHSTNAQPATANHLPLKVQYIYFLQLTRCL